MNKYVYWLSDIEPNTICWEFTTLFLRSTTVKHCVFSELLQHKHYSQKQCFTLSSLSYIFIFNFILSFATSL